MKPDNPRIREDKPVKYESPKGHPNEPYFPPHAAERLADPELPIFFTEGEKKALSLDQHGYAAIGLVGVYGWKIAKRNALIPSLAELEWAGRQVYIAFDSDLQRNEDVAAAETRLAHQLRLLQACVQVIRLPDGVPDENGNPTKRGVDDFLVQEGIAAFRELVANAQSPAEPSAMELLLAARFLDPNAVIQEYLQEHQQDEVSRIRCWRGSYYHYQDGHYAGVSEKEMEGMLVRHVNAFATHLTTSITGNCMLQLRAQTVLPDSTRPPAWLGEPPVPWLAEEVLACRSQLIHLPTLIGNGACILPATPRFFTTVALDYDFDGNASAPTAWLNFLDSVWPADLEAIQTLQEWFGYCLTLDTRQQKILMIVGPKRSGKTYRKKRCGSEWTPITNSARN